MGKFRDFFREFYGEFINYINCLPDKEDNNEEKDNNKEKDWNLWEEKDYSNSYEKIPPPPFPKLQQQPSERGFTKYLW